MLGKGNGCQVSPWSLSWVLLWEPSYQPAADLVQKAPAGASVVLSALCFWILFHLSYVLWCSVTRLILLQIFDTSHSFKPKDRL